MCDRNSVLIVFLILKIIILVIVPIVVYILYKRENKLFNFVSIVNILFIIALIIMRLTSNECVTNSNFSYLRNNDEEKYIEENPNSSEYESIYSTEQYLTNDSKNVYLRVHDSVKRQTLEIPINSILNISWRPNIVNNVELNTTVVYKLKDRLAKIYRLKENEHSQGYDADGNLVVVNRNEPFEKLLSRLMKYSTSCELISPKYLREDMLKLITDTISNYDNCL
jgi:hypothetical protein